MAHKMAIQEDTQKPKSIGEPPPPPQQTERQTKDNLDRFQIVLLPTCCPIDMQQLVISLVNLTRSQNVIYSGRILSSCAAFALQFALLR